VKRFFGSSAPHALNPSQWSPVGSIPAWRPPGLGALEIVRPSVRQVLDGDAADPVGAALMNQQFSCAGDPNMADDSHT